MVVEGVVRSLECVVWTDTTSEQHHHHPHCQSNHHHLHNSTYRHGSVPVTNTDKTVIPTCQDTYTHCQDTSVDCQDTYLHIKIHNMHSQDTYPRYFKTHIHPVKMYIGPSRHIPTCQDTYPPAKTHIHTAKMYIGPSRRIPTCHDTYTHCQDTYIYTSRYTTCILKTHTHLSRHSCTLSRHFQRVKTHTYTSRYT